jgi:thymidine kinase
MNHLSHNQKMSLELLIGPMFAGKSSAIQSIIRRHQALGWPVFVITHRMDTRYTNEPMIANHDKQMLPAVASDTLMPMLEHSEYKRSRLVIVEEAQFFPDLIPFIMEVVDTHEKHAVVVGLDGDAERRPFGRVLDLIPFADRVTKLTALCKNCRDATPAIFTFAYANQAEASAIAGIPCVGAGEQYVPLCRKHYLANKRPIRIISDQDNAIEHYGC